MNIEVLAWAPDKQTWEQAIISTMVPSTGLPLADYALDINRVRIEPPFVLANSGLNIDEIGEIPGATGWHVNLRFHEPLSDELIKDLPQTDAEGNLLPLFDRTHFLTLFPDATWHEQEDGVPGGYLGTKGLKLFDPATVKSRTRIWA